MPRDELEVKVLVIATPRGVVDVFVNNNYYTRIYFNFKKYYANIYVDEAASLSA